jgi:hypothetical protein
MLHSMAGTISCTSHSLLHPGYRSGFSVFSLYSSRYHFFVDDIGGLIIET